MNAAEKIAHAAERKAFETMLDSLIRKSQTKDVCTVANDFVNMVQKIHSSVWTPETFEMLHQIANDPDSKWAHYAERLLRERKDWYEEHKDLYHRIMGLFSFD